MRTNDHEAVMAGFDRLDADDKFRVLAHTPLAEAEISSVLGCAFGLPQPTDHGTRRGGFQTRPTTCTCRN